MNKTASTSNGAAIGHPGGGHTVVPVVMPISGGSRTYGYDGDILVSETWTIGGAVYIKTYTYTASKLTGESDWVKQ